MLDDFKLTPHFRLREFIASDVARERGIDNRASPEIVERLRYLASHLEDVRAVLGVPLQISSGYRCPALNRAVGGSVRSDHMQGLAADFVAPAFGDCRAVCKAIAASAIPYKQLIYEYRWVHISFPRPGEPAKRELLTLLKGGGYRVGV